VFNSSAHAWRERERERERETIHDLELGILSSVSAMKTKEHEQDVPRG
jgi:hypothetical protein